MNPEEYKKHYEQHIVNEIGEEKLDTLPDGTKVAVCAVGDGWKDGKVFNVLRFAVIREDGSRENNKYWVIDSANDVRLAVCDEIHHAALVCSALNLATGTAMKSMEDDVDKLAKHFRNDRECRVAADILCNTTNDVKRLEDKIKQLTEEGRSEDEVKAYMLGHKNDFARSGGKISIEESAVELVKHGIITSEEAEVAVAALLKAEGKMKGDKTPKSTW